MRRRNDRPTLITDAARSQEDQLRTREFRYVMMMLLRLACLLAAAVIAAAQPPLWWLWVGLCAAGMAFLPWIAVLIANDPLPKEKHRWRRHQPRPARTLPASTTPATGADPRPVRTIDHE